MTREMMKELDGSLEEVVREITTYWNSGEWAVEEMQTVAFVSIALQLRRLNNLIEGMKKKEKKDE